MAKIDEPYVNVMVESFEPSASSGKHGKVHIRPLAGQGFDQNLFVECSKSLSKDYPTGTQFRIRAKLTDREGGGEYLYSSWRWPIEVLSEDGGN